MGGNFCKTIFTCIVAVVIGFGLIGCTPSTVNIPTGCENSLIYKSVPDVKATGVILQLANLEALKNNVWKASEAKGIINGLLDMLNMENITYATFIQQAVANVKWLNENVAAETVIIINYVDALNKPIPIDKCDIGLLKTHLQKQLSVIAMSGK